jgi:hypothetical protein
MSDNYRDGRGAADFEEEPGMTFAEMLEALRGSIKLRLAGGLTRDADANRVFVICATGSVVSARLTNRWFNDVCLAGLAAKPGDTIFVPAAVYKTTFLQSMKNRTQILPPFAWGDRGDSSAGQSRRRGS